MAYKEVISKRRTVTFDLGTEKVTMTLKRFEGKVRQHDSLGRPAGWGMSGYTCVKCDHFPHADWRLARAYIWKRYTTNWSGTKSPKY